MRNKEEWMPTKFVMTEKGLRASRDPAEVGVGSRVIADTIAMAYEVMLRKHAKGKLLDLGCGKVPLYLVYRDMVDDVICVDWANSWHKNPHLDYEMDLSQPMDLPDAMVDTLLATDLIEHLPDPQLIWSEMSRLLKPGGKLLLGVPFMYWLHEVPHDYFRYTEYALRRYAEQNGLEVVELTPVGGALDVILDVSAKQITKWRRISLVFSKFASFLLRGSLGRRINERTWGGFPLAYVMVAQKPS